jgi:hypothetical protein
MGPFIKKGTMLLRHCFWSLYAAMRLGMSLVVEDVYILTDAPKLKMAMRLTEFQYHMKSSFYLIIYLILISII